MAREEHEREGPFLKFYPGDFLKDPCVQVLSFEARSVWLFMILLMHDSVKRGYLVTANGKQMTSKQLANALQISEARINAAWAEMEEAGTYSKTEDSIIYCRRMARTTELSEVRKQAGRKGGSRSKTQANPKDASDARVRSHISEVIFQNSETAAAFSPIVENLPPRNPPQAAAEPEVFKKFPQTREILRQSFPASDDAIFMRIVSVSLDRCPKATDAELAAALVRTHQGKHQRSAALWLSTVPAFLANGHGPSGDVCPRCRGHGAIFNPELEGQVDSAWRDLPEERIWVPCPHCSNVPRKPKASEKSRKEAQHG